MQKIEHCAGWKPAAEQGDQGGGGQVRLQSREPGRCQGDSTNPPWGSR